MITKPFQWLDGGAGTMRTFLVMVMATGLLFGCATPYKKQQRESKAGYHYQLGMAHMQDSAYQLALLEFNKGIKISPENESLLFALGHTHFQQQNYPRARDMMEQLIEVNPEHGEAVNYLGNILEKQGDMNGAMAMFSRASELPAYATPHFSLHNLGRIQLRMGDVAGAEASYRAAIRRVPEYYPARADLAKLYQDQRKWQQAADEWRIFVDIKPGIHDARYYLAQCYVELNQIVQAKIELKTFIDKVPEDHPLLPDARALFDSMK